MRSHSQTLDAVKAFINRWKGRGYEKGESQQFWTDLLHDVLDIETPSGIISFENQVKLSSTSFIDAYIAPTKVLIEQKSIDKDLRKAIKQSDGSLLNPFQQAKRYAAELPVSKHPRWVVTCNFQSFLIYDMENPHGEPEEILLENLEKDYYRLRFLVEDGKAHLKRELEISIKAGELVGKLYDAFLKQYLTVASPTPSVSAADLHSLNVLCVRLVFCLYAEDAGIFSKDQFYYYMAQYKPSQMRVALRELFTVLDTKIEDRDRFLDKSLKDFPYVNGSLFQQHPGEDIPQFDDVMSELLLKEASLGFDWSEISPTIFGAVFESTLNPETRRSGGMHYTSIENIHKVIDPLFLNDLRAEFEKIKEEKQDNKRKQKLEAFQDKLASLTFLDPACGSGNFLTETYISLRRLENEAISLRLKGQKLLGLEQLNPIKVNIHQFYGIEINDFAVTVATTALWIAESQMMHETERIIKFDLDYLPLKSFTNIHLGNALRMDWGSLFASSSPSGLTHPLCQPAADISPALSIREGEDLSGLTHPLCQPAADISPALSIREGEGEDYFRTSDNKMWGDLKERSREHRKAPTEAEEVLWQAIRNSKLGYKFRRQHAIHIYIADFVCLDKKLIVEVDGGYHLDENQQYIDAQRTHDLNALGFTVIRFTNDEVLSELQNVVEKIKRSLAENRSPSPKALMERGLGGEARTFDYIMGNPPFVGHQWRSKEQQEDMDIAFQNFSGNYGKLDYVACWYAKTMEYLDNQTECAYVSTNSIVQGESVATMWKPLFDAGLNITFAWQPFVWNSESNDKAHVHCVIIGFGKRCCKFRTLYQNESISRNVDNINGYLLNAPNVFIQNRGSVLTDDMPKMTKGSQPTDGGFLILSEDERKELVNKYPNSENFIKRFVSSDDYINNKYRYCLWLKGVAPNEYYKIKPIMDRLEKVAEMRRNSPTKSIQKDAETPMLFTQIRQPETNYLATPEVSSENRRYIPIGFIDKEIIASNKLYIIPDASLYLFGVLTSNVHNAWMRVVAGRLKSDYSYSPAVYNNFPWPTPTEAQKAKIEQTAQAILDARALYPDCSLAVLYKETTMPAELRKAHQNNDRAVMEAYCFDWRKMTESECVAELFKLYQKLVDAEKSKVPLSNGEGDLGGEATKPKRTRKKKTIEEKHD